VAGVCTACDVCPSGCPFTSLEDAINHPSTQNGDTIRICPGTYPTFHVQEGVTISKNLTIIGAGSGPGGTVLDGENKSRVLLTGEETTVTIRDLTITRGYMHGVGFLDAGAIYVNLRSTLNLERVTLTENKAEAWGGAIFVGTQGTLFVKDSQITKNSAALAGGIFASGGNATLDGTLVAENTAAQGGGVLVNVMRTLRMINGSRITRNVATQDAPSGGGIHNGGFVIGATNFNVFNNDPDNCFDSPGQGTGCPA
jgi:hypothetical protein